MPIGVFVNCLSVLIGGLLGAVWGHKLPERLRASMVLSFGIAALTMGVAYIVKIHTLPAVVLALILGSAIGELLNLEQGIAWCGNRVRQPIDRLFAKKKNAGDHSESLENLTAIVVLFCASGTGIFGALREGLTGDHSVLLTKSVLDFFTAGIFAASLGYIVMTICIPQFLILMGLFLSASLILPLSSPSMIADFTACGGMILLATGLRMSGIKFFPIGNMLPALLLVMPISYLWTTYLH